MLHSCGETEQCHVFPLESVTGAQELVCEAF